MYRFLLTPRWLAGLSLAVVLALACMALGTWQWDRREQARDRNAPVLANYALPPVALDDVLDDPTGEPLARSREWTPVTVAGSYRPQDTLLLRNRSLDGRPGYHVLVPLELAPGGTLLVDRGWLPTGATGAGPDDVPSPPTGPVDVVARLRPPEPALDRDAPPGQVQSIDLASIAATLQDPSLATAAYGVLASEEPAPRTGPVRLPRPVIDEGPHLSYALQWFVFALGALVGYAFLARRTAHDLRVAAGAAPPAARAARRRPTAEDEEDALLDAAERDRAR